jgi:hypothetical protein
MTRSMRHSPIVPRSNIETEKDEKKLAHQRERKWLHDHLNPQTASHEDFDLVDYHEHPKAGRDSFGKDGKEFVAHLTVQADPKILRK